MSAFSCYHIQKMPDAYLDCSSAECDREIFSARAFAFRLSTSLHPAMFTTAVAQLHRCGAKIRSGGGGGIEEAEWPSD